MISYIFSFDFYFLFLFWNVRVGYDELTGPCFWLHCDWDCLFWFLIPLTKRAIHGWKDILFCVSIVVCCNFCHGNLWFSSKFCCDESWNSLCMSGFRGVLCAHEKKISFFLSKIWIFHLNLVDSEIKLAFLWSWLFSFWFKFYNLQSLAPRFTVLECFF